MVQYLKVIFVFVEDVGLFFQYFYGDFIVICIFNLRYLMCFFVFYIQCLNVVNECVCQENIYIQNKSKFV